MNASIINETDFCTIPFLVHMPPKGLPNPPKRAKPSRHCSNMSMSFPTQHGSDVIMMSGWCSGSWAKALLEAKFGTAFLPKYQRIDWHWYSMILLPGHVCSWWVPSSPIGCHGGTGNHSHMSPCITSHPLQQYYCNKILATGENPDPSAFTQNWQLSSRWSMTPCEVGKLKIPSWFYP